VEEYLLEIDIAGLKLDSTIAGLSTIIYGAQT
jgi:hypothetical protein